MKYCKMCCKNMLQINRKWKLLKSNKKWVKSQTSFISINTTFWKTIKKDEKGYLFHLKWWPLRESTRVGLTIHRIVNFSSFSIPYKFDIKKIVSTLHRYYKSWWPLPLLIERNPWFINILFIMCCKFVLQKSFIIYPPTENLLYFLSL